MLRADFVFGVRVLARFVKIKFRMSRAFLRSPPPLAKKHRHPFITPFGDSCERIRVFAAFSTDFIFSSITSVPRRCSKPAKSSSVLHLRRARLESTFVAFAHRVVEFGFSFQCSEFSFQSARFTIKPRPLVAVPEARPTVAALCASKKPLFCRLYQRFENDKVANSRTFSSATPQKHRLFRLYHLLRPRADWARWRHDAKVGRAENATRRSCSRASKKTAESWPLPPLNLPQ
jgi:hypothetical protein